jgi:2-phosphoglycerate kinase
LLTHPLYVLLIIVNWLIVILLLPVGYQVYKILLRNRPEQKIEEIEEKASHLYANITEELEKGIESEKQLLKGKSTIPKHTIEELLESNTQCLHQLKDMLAKFTRLKERYKHQPAKRQLKIYMDWFSYNNALKQTAFENRLFNNVTMPNDEDYKIYLKKLEEIRIEKEEIERRFDKWLAA